MGLEILKYDPNDYKLGEVLSSKHGDTLSSEEKISAVLSLYFQWPEESSAQVYFDVPGRPTFKVSMDYDKEERKVTQILLKLPNGVNLKNADKAFMRLEVFNGCYEFESNVLEIFADDGCWVIIEAPTKLKSVKVRRSNRIQIEEKISGILKDSKSQKNVNITSITLNGVVVDCKVDNTFKGYLDIGAHSFHASYARDIENYTALQIDFKNDKEASTFFSIYRMIAYPNLKPRTDFNFKDLYQLYVDAGFFGNFAGKFDEEDREEKASQCWESLKSANDITTADLVAVDSEGNPTGSSSCALVFKKQDTEYWVFHQLCIKKDETSFDVTCDLYAWRAEYLWIRKPSITSVFWFRSESRWLERIYVKYSMQSPERCFVRPADLFAYLHSTNKNSLIGNTQIEKYGDEDRAYCSIEECDGGLGPDYVHINRNMNIIQSENDDWELVTKVANEMNGALNKEQSYFRVVMPEGANEPALTNDKWERQKGVNRHAEIKKEGMLDFISCLKHSIAITKKKHQKAG